ncbi:MAG: hypothetical protein ACXVHL_33685, partial [Solirubrobacteraceae bacterium]
VQSFDAIERWLPPAGMPCHVIITSIPEPRAPGWTVLTVEPLSDEASIELVAELAGKSVATEFGETLAEQCAGLPVQICPIAAVLGDDHLLSAASVRHAGEALGRDGRGERNNERSSPVAGGG